MEEKGDKDKINAAKEEAESHFGIRFTPLRFGQDISTTATDMIQAVCGVLSLGIGQTMASEIDYNGKKRVIKNICYDVARQTATDTNGYTEIDENYTTEKVVGIAQKDANETLEMVRKALAEKDLAGYSKAMATLTAKVKTLNECVCKVKYAEFLATEHI